MTERELNEQDYRKIHTTARVAKKAFFKGYACCDIPIEDDFSYWVMKETQRYLASLNKDRSND